MTQIFAHRGHHADQAENSVAAVAAACAVGADGVEIDVWRTRDGHLVVNHDRCVQGLSLPETRRPELGQLRGAPPAALEEILEAARDLRINVEIKATRSPSYNMAVARDVASYLDSSAKSDQCLVSSFSLEVCEAVRAASPTRPVGWLLSRQPALGALGEARNRRLTSLHLPYARASARVLREAAESGIEIHVWTPNLERDLGAMLARGVDALITDDVPMARRLRERLREAHSPGPR